MKFQIAFCDLRRSLLSGHAEENQNSKASPTDRGPRVPRAWPRSVRDEANPQGRPIIEYIGPRVPWEEAPEDENNPQTILFRLGNREVNQPEIGRNDAG